MIATAPSPAPSPSLLCMDAAALNAFMGRAFPLAETGSRGQVVSAEPGLVQVLMPFNERALRPGGVISGPTMMGLADMAVYALVIAHVGDVPMAVTTSLTMHFLRGAAPGPLHARARLLKLGRRIVTADVLLWTEAEAKPCAHATVAYALPGDIA